MCIKYHQGSNKKSKIVFLSFTETQLFQDSNLQPDIGWGICHICTATWNQQAVRVWSKQLPPDGSTSTQVERWPNCFCASTTNLLSSTSVSTIISGWCSSTRDSTSTTLFKMLLTFIFIILNCLEAMWHHQLLSPCLSSLSEDALHMYLTLVASFQPYTTSFIFILLNTSFVYFKVCNTLRF